MHAYMCVHMNVCMSICMYVCVIATPWQEDHLKENYESSPNQLLIEIVSVVILYSYKL